MTPTERPTPGPSLPVAPPEVPDAEGSPQAHEAPLPGAAPSQATPGEGRAGGSGSGTGKGSGAVRPLTAIRDRVRSKRPLSLRSRLVGVLLVLMALVAAVIGGVTHASMAARLDAEMNNNLAQAWNRAESQSKDIRTYANTAGQAPGTVVVINVDGTSLTSPQILDASTGRLRALPDADKKLLESAVADLPNRQTTQLDTRLSIGPYRLIVKPVPVTISSQDGSNSKQATAMVGIGLPSSDMKNTLATLDLSMVLVSLGGLLLVGVSGTLLVTRALRPLARVSAVASAVAEQPLEKGDVDVAIRVAPEDAQPGTEVGNVGQALNNLLDNVDGALEVRARSEARMRRFAADASHELRTPLAAIQGYSELLGATEALSDDGERSLERVREQTRRMTGLVENLLLLARLDEGKPAAEEPVDLTRLAAELSRDFSVAAPDHEWALEALEPEPVVVLGDESQLNRVLSNLMSNARKHTSDGTRVTVSVGLTPSKDAALLRVVDNGEGIDPEFVDRIFDRFARADASRSGSTPTTGLGLSIVKAIVEAHGGEITVRSLPGETEFRVRLPLAPASVR